MPVCAVRLCHNHAGKPNNNTKITFHRFPADAVIASRWIEVIQRTRSDCLWQPHKTSVVCSEHFTDDDMYYTENGLRRRLKSGAVPTRCLFLSAMDSTNIQYENIVEEPSTSKTLNFLS
ncbi:unnamed protein product [Chilo suppressalis]|uniref:THAP-type domain-containing protein n=1 Tax=Chilo suppressalis TaxID=168631 RepID=A0ABN8B4K6_CHISP|nr:hypothetical protein evm_003530 [Chilo suppressalis]CAH0404186.1 unnamed protein product [Chilo suppressalis]